MAETRTSRRPSYCVALIAGMRFGALARCLHWGGAGRVGARMGSQMAMSEATGTPPAESQVEQSLLLALHLELIVFVVL